MFWDCPACGTQKLLGVTHRYCPACGSPQDSARRYFPPENEQIAVRDHVLVGRDRNCPACDTPNANNANNCLACGSLLEGAAQVSTQADLITDDSGNTSKDPTNQPKFSQASAQGIKPKQTKTRKINSKKKWLAGGGVASGAAALLIFSSPVDLQVTSHQWSRTISIEVFGAVDDKSWCNDVPTGAQDISRSKKVKDYEKVPDGEKCVTRKVDNGDGSYSSKRECEPKFRKEPIYADWCKYTVNRWHPKRKVSSSGRSLTPAPKWPSYKLAKTGKCIGCEREGRKSETYSVLFIDQDKKDYRCNYNYLRWPEFALGSSWSGEVNKVTGLGCNQLNRQQ